MSSSIRMPFGKFKNKKIEDLPNYYLKWIAENLRERTPRDVMIIKAADEEYQFRNKWKIYKNE